MSIKIRATKKTLTESDKETFAKYKNALRPLVRHYFKQALFDAMFYDDDLEDNLAHLDLSEIQSFLTDIEE